jgi:hypothetical protein
LRPRAGTYERVLKARKPRIITAERLIASEHDAPGISMTAVTARRVGEGQTWLVKTKVGDDPARKLGRRLPVWPCQCARKRLNQIWRECLPKRYVGRSGKPRLNQALYVFFAWLGRLGHGWGDSIFCQRTPAREISYTPNYRRVNGTMVLFRSCARVENLLSPPTIPKTLAERNYSCRNPTVSF